jgi:hypothetical protein
MSDSRIIPASGQGANLQAEADLTGWAQSNGVSLSRLPNGWLVKTPDGWIEADAGDVITIDGGAVSLKRHA